MYLAQELGEDVVAFWQATAQCQWGEPTDKYQDVCTEIAPGASLQASDYGSNMDATSNRTQSISSGIP